MNPISIYIYGVPDGFNLLSGTAQDQEYYQRFYNTQRKGEELVIERREGGICIYSYLRYGLVSSEGREGSFFGLSLVLTAGNYLSDVVRLRELFVAIYEQLVLGEDRLIRPIPGTSSARYNVRKFVEREDLCRRIEHNLRVNTEQVLSSSVMQFERPINPDTLGRVLPLALSSSNEEIARALANYSMIRLSASNRSASMSSPLPQDLLSDEWIHRQQKGEGQYKDFIISMLKGEKSLEQVSRLRADIGHTLVILEQYKSRQPELAPLCEGYERIYQELSSYRPQSAHAHSSPHTFSSSAPSPEEEKEGRSFRLGGSSQKTSKQIIFPKRYILGGGAAVALCLALVWGFKQFGTLGRKGSTGTDVLSKNNNTSLISENKDDSTGLDTTSEEGTESSENNLAQSIEEVKQMIEQRKYAEASKKFQELAGIHLELHDPNNKYRVAVQEQFRGCVRKDIQDLKSSDLKTLKGKQANLAKLQSDNVFGDLISVALITELDALVKSQEAKAKASEKEDDISTPEPALYKASSSYIAEGKAISKGIINAKQGEHYVIINYTEKTLERVKGGESEIQLVPNSDAKTLRIRLIGLGSFSFKVNGTEYVFNVGAN